MKDTKIGGRTSQDVSRTGTYTPECCNVEMVFEKGQTFQRCPRCFRLVEWQLVVLQHQKKAA